MLGYVTDTDDTTVLHVPSIGLVVAGDVAYNGVHQYLLESGGGRRTTTCSTPNTYWPTNPAHANSMTRCSSATPIGSTSDHCGMAHWDYCPDAHTPSHTSRSTSDPGPPPTRTHQY